MSARAWRGALVLLMVCGVAFAVRPLAHNQGPENWFPHADKVHHLWYFGLLWWMGLRAGAQPGWRWAAALLAYGGLIELAQSLTATRAASAQDMVADALGIALGWLLTRAWARRASGREPQEHGR
jgi:VanZ family protein